MTEIRFGTFNSPGLFSVVKPGGNGADCEMGDVAGESMNPIFAATKKYGYNCTIKIYEGMGSLESGRWRNGILAALVNDEIDYSVMSAFYPLEGNSEHVEQSVIYAEDTMTIVSGYFVGGKSETLDLLHLYGAIPTGLWIALAICYLALTILLFVALKRFKSNNSKMQSIWISTCALLDQDNFPPGSTCFIANLSMATSVSLFFIMNYAMNLMSTDLVVVDKPSVIASYRDIIDNDVAVASSKMLPELGKFLTAPPGSTERKLMKNVICMDFDDGSVMRLRIPFAQQKVVFLGRENFVDSATYATILSFGDAPEFDDLRVLRVQDDHAKKYTSSILMNKNSDQRFLHLMRNVNLKQQHSGILTKMYSDIPLRTVEVVIGPLAPSVMRKQTKFVEEQQADFVPIGFHHLMLSVKLYFALIALAVSALIFEKIFWRQMEKKRNQVGIVKRSERVNVMVTEIEVKPRRFAERLNT